MCRCLSPPRASPHLTASCAVTSFTDIGRASRHADHLGAPRLAGAPAPRTTTSSASSPHLQRRGRHDRYALVLVRSVGARGLAVAKFGLVPGYTRAAQSHIVPWPLSEHARSRLAGTGSWLGHGRRGYDSHEIIPPSIIGILGRKNRCVYAKACHFRAFGGGGMILGGVQA